MLGLAISGLEWARSCRWLSSGAVMAVGMTLQLQVRPFSFSLLQPLRTATGVLLERRGWLLRLSDGDTGAVGWGEVAPLGSEQWFHCQLLVGELTHEVSRRRRHHRMPPVARTERKPRRNEEGRKE